MRVVERLFAGGRPPPDASEIVHLRRARRVLLRFAALLTVAAVLACVPGLMAGLWWILFVPVGVALAAVPGARRLDRLIAEAHDRAAPGSGPDLRPPRFGS